MSSTIMFVLVLLTQPNGSTAEAIRLQSRALAERNKIEKGFFDVDSVGWDTIQGARYDYHWSMKMVRDGNSLRNDSRNLLTTTDLVEIHSWGPRYVINYTNRPAADGRQMAVSVRDNILGDDDRSKLTFVVDPHHIGFHPAQFMSCGQIPLESYIGSKSFKVVHAVEEDVIDGQRCRKISMSNIFGAEVIIWIDPERDASVVRYDSSRRANNQTSLWRIENKLAWITPANHWFPETCQFTSMIDDKIVGEEKTTIRVHGLNEVVDPRSFELATMAIPPGTAVVYTGPDMPSGSKQWDGQAIVSLDPRVAKSQLATGRPIFLIPAVACAAGAAVLIGLGWRRRAKLAASRN